MGCSRPTVPMLRSLGESVTGPGCAKRAPWAALTPPWVCCFTLRGQGSPGTAQAGRGRAGSSGRAGSWRCSLGSGRPGRRAGTPHPGWPGCWGDSSDWAQANPGLLLSALGTFQLISETITKAIFCFLLTPEGRPFLPWTRETYPIDGKAQSGLRPAGNQTPSLLEAITPPAGLVQGWPFPGAGVGGWGTTAGQAAWIPAAPLA